MNASEEMIFSPNTSSMLLAPWTETQEDMHSCPSSATMSQGLEQYC